MTLPDRLSALLPDLRRLAGALTGSPKARADDLVLRALHQFLRDAPPQEAGQIKGRLQGLLIRLVELRPLEPCPASMDPMERALRDLPAGHRAALILVDVERCSYAQAAQVLGISRNVFMGRLATARQRIAQQMQEAPQGHQHNPSHLRLVQ